MRLQHLSGNVSTPLASQPIELNHFQMNIPDGGYTWLDNALPLNFPRAALHLGPATYMVEKARAEGHTIPVPGVGYFPMSTLPTLFLRFKNLNLNRDSILEFANQYGWIGEVCRLPGQKHGFMGAVGLHTWREEIKAMILADYLRLCIQTDNRAALRPYFAWDPKSFAVRLQIAVREREICAVHPSTLEDGNSSWLADLVRPHQVAQLQAIGWNHGDVLGPARLALMDLVNTRLSVHCHPRLFLNKHGNFVGHQNPVNLLGCIWLQLYMTLIGQLRFRICTVCNLEMDVTGRRSTRKMHDACSKRARQMRWRDKKRAQSV